MNSKVFAFEKNINDKVHLSFTGTRMKCYSFPALSLIGVVRVGTLSHCTDEQTESWRILSSHMGSNLM